MDVSIKETKMQKNGNMAVFFDFFGVTKYVIITPKTFNKYGINRFGPGNVIIVSRTFQKDKEMYKFLGFKEK